MLHARRFFPFALFLAVASPAFSNDANPPQPDAAGVYEFRADHDRDGIGKFYMGREIAHVMGHQAADWLDRPEREEEEKTGLLVEALKLQPGDAVADIGCGTGYLSRQLAKKVGEKGVVYGEDIQQEMLDILQKKMTTDHIANVKPVLGTITDPKLPAESVNAIMMVDVYHEFDHPREMTVAMIRALKHGGRLIFVEYRGEDPAVPIKRLHKMTVGQVKKEMSATELKFSESIETLPRQHVIVFTKP